MSSPFQVTLTTPLDKDLLLVSGFEGSEGISQLFNFKVELLAEVGKTVAFDKLLGQKVTIKVEHQGKPKRVINGMVNRMSQGSSDSTFTTYRLEMVPELWLLTKRIQSRIFQHETIPDIIKKVLGKVEIKDEMKNPDGWKKRDFCVQYRESDFDFFSRLMEEEGMYYYFVHSASGHQMVLANLPDSHQAMPGESKLIFETVTGGNRPEGRIIHWEKTQEIRSGKVTLWDHCFELTGDHLDAEANIEASVTVGKATHKNKIANNDKLEIYDYPGGYAQRFDGIDAGGGEVAANLQGIFKDNKRTALIRMEQEALEGVVLNGSGNCINLFSGHKFTLERHPNANGDYVVTTVSHSCRQGEFRTGDSDFSYHNSFTAIPFAVPYRPARKTERPTVKGTQTATVVGGSGKIIDVDKYGRVKVEFHWNRDQKKSLDSSCWVRVSQYWAGAKWGSMHIPHVGHEVVVDFEEGDPDRPLIIGRVYNDKNMPPFTLPDKDTWSITRDYGDNEMSWQGKPGEQQIYIFCPTGNTHFSCGHTPAQPIPVAPGGTYTKKPGPCPCPPPGAPNKPKKTGMKIGTDSFIDFFCGEDFQLDVLGEQFLHVKGPSHDNVLGYKSIFIGGIKNEVIVGFEIKHIGGLKREFIFGAEFKTIRGLKWELVKGAVISDTPKDKTANCKALYHKVKTAAKTKADKIVDDIKTKIEQKVNKMQTTAKDMKEKYDKMKADIKGKYDAKIGEVKETIKGKLKQVANGAKMTLIKLALAAKLNCNSGNFKCDD